MSVILKPGDPVTFRTGRVDSPRRGGSYVRTFSTVKGSFHVIAARGPAPDAKLTQVKVRPANVSAA